MKTPCHVSLVDTICSDYSTAQNKEANAPEAAEPTPDEAEAKDSAAKEPESKGAGLSLKEIFMEFCVFGDRNNKGMHSCRGSNDTTGRCVFFNIAWLEITVVLFWLCRPHVG
jgi:hypothetical protein